MKQLSASYFIIEQDKAGVSQRAASKLIDGLCPGHQHIPFWGQVITSIFF